MENDAARVDDMIVNNALKILRRRVTVAAQLSNSQDLCNMLVVEFGSLEREVFGAVLMDANFKYIDHKVLFLGTITNVVVHPRELIKYALQHNASQMVVFHNHPAGSMMPSSEDISLTETLKKILGYVDVALLDHILVRAKGAFSFAEHLMMPE